MEFLNTISENGAIIGQVAAGVVTAAAAISTVTPTKTDNEVVNVLLKVLNLFGLNVGRARNADDY